jgi:hypothetical protein
VLDNVHEVASQNLWFNSNLLINNKVCFFERWYERGINMLYHLLDELTYKLLDYNQFCGKFNFHPPFTEFYGIITCIPQDWKTLLKESVVLEDEEGELKLINKLDIAEKPSKFFYNELINKKFIPPIDNSLKWQTECNEIWSEKEWFKSFADNRSITICNKLRSYRYNLLIRNVPYNKRLCYMEESDSPNCPSCTDNVETLMHLYWDCPESKVLWQGVKGLWEYSYNQKTDLCFKNCILGVFTEAEQLNHSNQLNTRIFKLLSCLTCHYIHTNKCLGKRTTVEGLIYKFVDVYKTEISLATRNNTTYFLDKKWNKIGISLNPLLE